MVVGHKEDIAAWLDRKKQELERLLTEIDATPEQKKKFWEIIHHSKSQVAPSVDALFEKARDLVKYVGKVDANEQEALRRTEDFEELRSKIIAVRIQMLFKIKQILNPEQQKLFSKHLEEKIGEFQEKLSSFLHLSP
jgi:Spy/CpxP family protein refolding chaperone